MTDDELQRSVQQLLDRQAILDCLDRYARGLDRKDVDLLLSAYHPDAVDHHGPMGDFSPQQLLEDWSTGRDQLRLVQQHVILNSRIELDGDVAHGETYFQLVIRIKPEEVAKAGHDLTVSGGRYVDRFERRDGAWRIAKRVVIGEWSAALDLLNKDSRPLWSRRDKSDPSYARPLLGPPTD